MLMGGDFIYTLYKYCIWLKVDQSKFCVVDCRPGAPPVSVKAGLSLSTAGPEASLWIEPKTLPQARTTPDYAEVGQRSVSSFQCPDSAAAYATTTLVPGLQSSVASRDRGVRIVVGLTE